MLIALTGRGRHTQFLCCNGNTLLPLRCSLCDNAHTLPLEPMSHQRYFQSAGICRFIRCRTDTARTEACVRPRACAHNALWFRSE
jgi:hypothetical protein